MKQIEHIFIAFAAVALVMSCEKAVEQLPVVELGCEYPDVEMPLTGGIATFNILCTGDAVATIPDDVDWLSFSDGAGKSMSFTNDKCLIVNCAANDGEERKAVITVTIASRSINLTISQENTEGVVFFFPQHNVLVKPETGLYAVPFTCKVPVETIKYSITYENGKGWIEEPVPGVSEGEFSFMTKENMSPERRGAIVTLTSKDKIGRELSARLYVSQMGFGEADIIPVTVQDVRNMTVNDLDGEGRIRKNYVLTARVVNDNSEGNGGPNKNISIIVQDLNVAARTLYLQSTEPDESGQYCGVRLQFRTPEDNSLNRYDLIEINIKGLKFEKAGQQGGKIPFHVNLSDAGVVNVVSSTRGSASDLPVITRKINELTDDDIYTYVKIDNCEIPFRKGPYVPLDLRYQHIANKYPMAMRDADGSIMYLLSNTTCDWARDGEGLPEGSGDVSGVIVHEQCDNFEWDSKEEAQSPVHPDYLTDIGYIGKYQIRPVCKPEINISDDLADAVSQLIAEWRYCNSSYPSETVVNTKDDIIKPTYPAVADPLTDDRVVGHISYSYGKIGIGKDWTHLGPVTDARITDIPGGNGVTDAMGRSIHWDVLSYCVTSGIINDKNGSSWHGGRWFSKSHTKPELEKYYWEIAFSTKGLSSANAPLSLNIGTSSSVGSDTGSPRYWIVRYSTDQDEELTDWESVTGASYDYEDWVDLTAKGDEYTYTTPDFPIITSMKQYNLPGNKFISINFPSDADIWDKDMVYIHLHAAFDKACDNLSGPVSYDGTYIRDSRRAALNYVGIRCMK